MDIKERIETQIAEMETQLAAFVDDANRQIAAQQGGIQALRLLAAGLEMASLNVPDVGIAEEE